MVWEVDSFEIEIARRMSGAIAIGKTEKLE
jgi:hypothetical protein